jgi:uncharacterized protein (DUF885 family)
MNTLTPMYAAARFFSICASALFFSILVALVVAGCADKPQSDGEQANTSQPSPSLTLTQWLDEQYEQELMFSPVSLTFLGRKERNDEIDALTYEAFAEQIAWKKASVEKMQTLFDRAALTPDERLSYDLWIYQLEEMQASAPFFYDGLVFDQMNGVQSFLPTFLINFHRVDEPADLDAYIKRIEAVAPRTQEAIDNAAKGLAKGVISPGFALEGVIEQSRKVISGQPFDATSDTDSDLWADLQTEIQTLLDAQKIDAQTAADLRAQAKTALLGKLMPAYENIIQWAENALDQAPGKVTGVNAQPNGDAYYKFRLRDQTTTDLTADEIHQIGLDEVARLRREMEQVKEQAGFEGSLQAFFAHVREGQWNYYPDTDPGRQAYIDDATAAIDGIKAQLPNYFGLLPKADLIVKRVEPFRERDGAAQHYYSGTPDGSRPGIYYAHLSDMTAMPKNQLEVIAYHEGLPGHHMQISIAQELTGVPTFRTQARFTAYSEGWGLYAEYLAKEMPGTYTDPYQDFGRLTGEIWRAIRLVVDTGLHAKGWTEQQAIDYFAANSPEPEESIRSEVQRYIVMPGQATTYKIGMLKILELRTKAKAELGERFDIRQFHDAILDGGALPLPLLERKVSAWISEVRQ